MFETLHSEFHGATYFILKVETMKITLAIFVAKRVFLALILLCISQVAFASTGTLVLTTDTILAEEHQGNILINASKITLDCAGHTVSGPGAPGFNGGIEVADRLNGVTVKRCKVTGFNVNGIFGGGGATDSRFEANVVYNNGNHGIHLDFGSGYVVLRNTCRSNGAIGIVLTGGTNSWIVQNTVEDNHNWAGIALLDGSHDDFIVGNTARRNSIGIVLDGATHNQVKFNSTSSNDTEGVVLIRKANHNLLEFNRADQNAIGFHTTDGSDSNEIRNNQANRNTSSGFGAYRSNENKFKENTADKNGNYGFVVFGGASFNTLIENSAHGNQLFDGYDEGTGTGNLWTKNRFGKIAGF
jgi:parallel beta-helix repeat protein